MRDAIKDTFLTTGLVKCAQEKELQQVDRNGRVSIYHQIALSLEQRIASGEWPIGAKLPSERVMAESYGTSRTTMRQALGVLAQTGLVERRRPGGTFITKQPEKLTPTLSIPVNYIRSMIHSGYDVTLETLSVTCYDASEDAASKALGLLQNDKIITFNRRIICEGSPIAYVQSKLSERQFPGLHAIPLLDDSIHKTIHKHFKVLIVQADHTIESETSDQWLASELDIPEGSPILLLESLFFDVQENATEHVITYWRGDLMKLRLSTHLDGTDDVPGLNQKSS